MSTKKESGLRQDGIVFCNPVKFKRASDILALINGETPSQHIKSEYSSEGQAHLQEHFAKALKDEGIKPDSKDALLFIYKGVGGGITTYEKQQKLKNKAAKDKKKSLRVEEGEEDVADEAEDDEEEKDETDTDEE